MFILIFFRIPFVDPVFYQAYKESSELKLSIFEYDYEDTYLEILKTPKKTFDTIIKIELDGELADKFEPDELHKRIKRINILSKFQNLVELDFGNLHLDYYDNKDYDYERDGTDEDEDEDLISNIRDFLGLIPKKIVSVGGLGIEVRWSYATAAEFISHFKALKSIENISFSIHNSNYNMDPENVESFTSALSKQTNLTHLDISFIHNIQYSTGDNLSFFPPETFSVFKQLTNLTNLNLYLTEIDFQNYRIKSMKDDIVFLKDLKPLTKLVVHFGSSGIANKFWYMKKDNDVPVVETIVENLKQLIFLQFTNDIPMSSRGSIPGPAVSFKGLEQFYSLMELTLKYMNVKGSDLNIISKIPNLKSFILEEMVDMNNDLKATDFNPFKSSTIQMFTIYYKESTVDQLKINRLDLIDILLTIPKIELLNIWTGGVKDEKWLEDFEKRANLATRKGINLIYY